MKILVWLTSSVFVCFIGAALRTRMQTTDEVYWVGFGVALALNLVTEICKPFNSNED